MGFLFSGTDFAMTDSLRRMSSESVPESERDLWFAPSPDSPEDGRGWEIVLVALGITSELAGKTLLRNQSCASPLGGPLPLWASGVAQMAQRRPSLWETSGRRGSPPYSCSGTSTGSLSCPQRPLATGWQSGLGWTRDGVRGVRTDRQTLNTAYDQTPEVA